MFGFILNQAYIPKSGSRNQSRFLVSVFNYSSLLPSPGMGDVGVGLGVGTGCLGFSALIISASTVANII
jgi:hypothetical protein